LKPYLHYSNDGKTDPILTKYTTFYVFWKDSYWFQRQLLMEQLFAAGNVKNGIVEIRGRQRELQ